MKALIGIGPYVPSTYPPLTTRVSPDARKKLEEAGEGTLYRSAYQVASRLLEVIPKKEVERYLQNPEE